MKLKSARVQNFRSVEDSGEFSVEHLTCLVGKNEAGKTAILQALAGLNAHPATPFSYELERDYPKRYLARYKERHPDGEAVVLTSEWQLDDESKDAIISEFGEKALTGTTVTVTGAYNSSPAWKLPISTKNVIDHMIAQGNFSAPEKSQLGQITTNEKFKKKLTELAPQNEKHKALLDKLMTYPNGSLVSRVRQICELRFPSFMYFSSYDRMKATVQLDTLQGQVNDGTLFSNDALRGERLFWEFLEFSGVSLEEIIGATTFESFNSRLQSASNTLTEEILEYWTQNQDIEVRVNVAAGLPADPSPYNQGKVGRARIYNLLHKADTSFSERSAGFAWFFSFLIKFDRVKKESERSVFLLLDEPGLTLHGKAQADLLRYFNEKLAPHHQILYSTHSPFMVPSENLMSSRIVEDLIENDERGRRVPVGTKVREDVLSPDRDSVFPLQGALGYSLTQTLFVGKHTLLVEGPSDILYLKALSLALAKRGRTSLDPAWAICPAGGLGNIQAFVSLFSGNGLDIIALCDSAKKERNKLEEIRKRQILKAGGLLTVSDFVEKDEADVEDLLRPELFCRIVNAAYELPTAKAITPASLEAADPHTVRQVKKAEAYFNSLPDTIPLFDHFTPSSWLIANPAILDGDDEAITQTLDQAEKLFVALNNLKAG